MRRKNLEEKDINVIEDILKECKVCRISLCCDGVPYIVPMNFGYDLKENNLTLYFHSALEGRKTDALNKLMYSHTGRYFDMSGEKAVVDKTLVFKIETNNFTCKVKKGLV